MKYWVTVNGKKFEVDVEQAPGGQAVNPGENSSAAVQPGSVKSGDGDLILAPMPGTSLEVKVGEGQAVKKGDVLFILEAMKMENEIMAGRDGSVARITVARGASVKTGDCLAVLK